MGVVFRDRVRVGGENRQFIMYKNPCLWTDIKIQNVCVCACFCPAGSDVLLDVSKGDKSQSDHITPTNRW